MKPYIQKNASVFENDVESFSLDLSLGLFFLQERLDRRLRKCAVTLAPSNVATSFVSEIVSEKISSCAMVFHILFLALSIVSDSTVCEIARTFRKADLLVITEQAHFDFSTIQLRFFFRK